MSSTFGLVQTAAPTSEPVTTAEAKEWLRWAISPDDATQDATIADLITAAREYCEEFTGRQLMTATWRLSLDGFPGMCFDSPEQDEANWWLRSVIHLPRPPLQSVSSITYVDTTGTTTTLASTEYEADTDHLPARIRPAYGKIWPVNRVQLAPVKITFVAGYTSAALVPKRVKQAMRLLIAADYANREATAVEMDRVHSLLTLADSGGYY